MKYAHTVQHGQAIPTLVGAQQQGNTVIEDYGDVEVVIRERPGRNQNWADIRPSGRLKKSRVTTKQRRAA